MQSAPVPYTEVWVGKHSFALAVDMLDCVLNICCFDFQGAAFVTRRREQKDFQGV